MRRVLVVLFSLFASACGTSFPPGAFDWGHGATPLAKAGTRAQVGGGGGAAWNLYTPGLPAGFGGGGGGGLELQLTDWLSLRGDASLGAEWSFLSGAPSLAGAGYLGTQLNFTPQLAARARVGLGGAGLNLRVAPTAAIAHGEGEAGLVYTFDPSPSDERWIYAYGTGRVSGEAPTSPVSLGAGVSMGWSHKIVDDLYFYTSGRGDVTVAVAVGNTSVREAGLVPLAALALQVGFTKNF